MRRFLITSIVIVMSVSVLAALLYARLGSPSPAAQQESSPSSGLVQGIIDPKTTEEGEGVIDRDWTPAGPVPRMADGKPNLSGVWWRGADTPLRSSTVGVPRSGPPRAPDPNEHFMLPPSSLYQPWAAAKAATLSEKDDPALRCLPSVNGPNNAIMQILHTPQFVAVLQETYHGFRLIPTDPGRQHNVDAPPAYRGDSVGRWEGDTLVVDVTNFTDKNWLNAQGEVSFHSDALHMTERYTRIAANALEVEKTYEDPKVLTAAWTAPKRILRLAPFDQIMEVMCTGVETAALMEEAAKQNYGKAK